MNVKILSSHNPALQLSAFDISVIFLLLCITLYVTKGLIISSSKSTDKNVEAQPRLTPSVTKAEAKDKNSKSTTSKSCTSDNNIKRNPSFRSESSFSDTASQDEEESTSQDQDEGINSDAEAIRLGAPIFPYLCIRNKVKNSVPPRLFPNAANPQALKSEYVTKGSALCCLRLKNVLGKDIESYDYYERFFKGKQRNLEFQLQVTLKNDPRGIVYLGGEIPNQMQLGLVTRGLCKAILAVTNKLSSHAHASFGKNLKESKHSEKELPHIVFPLFSAATKLVITRAGDTPPKVGDDIVESPESKKLRKKQGINRPGDIKAGDTITFSINTMYVDLVRWKVINIPGLKDLDLCMFWDTMPLSIVLYDTASVPSKERHINKYKRYFLNFEMKNTAYTRPAKSVEPYFRFQEGGAKVGDANVGGVKGIDAAPDTISSGDSNSSLGSIDLGLDDEDKYNERGQKERKNNKKSLPIIVNATIHIPAVVEHSHVVESFNGKNTKVRKQMSLAVFCTNTKKQHRDLRCYVHTFASFTSTELPECLRGFLHKSELKSMEAYPWKLENLRSKLDFGFSNTRDTNQIAPSWLNSSNTITLLTAKERRDMGVTLSSKSLNSVRVISECPVLHAEKEIKWCEKWAMICTSISNTDADMHETCCVSMFNCNSSKPSCVINCDDIMGVTEIDNELKNAKTLIPFNTDYPALEIETLGRVYIIGFRNKNMRSEFRVKLSSFLEKERNTLRGDLEMSFNASEIGQNLFFQTDSINAKYVDENDTYFGSNKRVIVNSRSLHFGCFPTNEYFHKNDNKLLRRSSFSKLHGKLRRKSLINEWFSVMFAQGFNKSGTEDGELNQEKQQKDIQRSRLEPWEQSAILLRAALKLIKSEPPSQKDFIDVCELASSLKRINMAKRSKTMSEEHKLCFFLNIYHALRIHASFILGAPSSIFGWDKFAQRISYVIGGMVFSLAEIEHCILRKPSSTVKFFFVDINYASTAFTQMFELKKREPRINFCLNYGNISSAEQVPIFEMGSDPETFTKRLDSLLTKTSQAFLDEQLIIDLRKKVIRIPKICSWYAKDFFEVGTKDTSKRPLAHALFRYMSPKMQHIFTRLCTESDFNVKVRSFHFTQRVSNSMETQ